MLNCWEFSARLFSCQLLVQFGDIVVPLCLVARSSYWGSQVVLLSEILDLELAATVPGAIGEDRLGAGQASWLFINQPHVPVEPWMTPRDKNLHSQELIGGWTMTCSFPCVAAELFCLFIIHSCERHVFSYLSPWEVQSPRSRTWRTQWTHHYPSCWPIENGAIPWKK